MRQFAMKKYRYINYFSFLLLIAIGLLSYHLFAAAPSTVPPPTPTVIGQVVWVKGLVKAIEATGQTRTLQRRSPIYGKDTLVTDQSGTGEVVFSDNSLLTLSADTTFRIDQYQFGKNVPADKAKFVGSIVKGGFRTITGLIPKQNASNYQLNSPVATIGVRGTSYAAVFKGGQLFVKYFSGQPCINNKKGLFCLSLDHQFASVANSNSAPTALSKDPGVFVDVPDPTPSNFTFGPKVGPGGIINPTNNSFCIQ